jgi:hypothetical protein
VKYLVMVVHPERRGVGNLEGIIEPARWEAVGDPVQANGPREAVEGYADRVVEGLLTAVPIEGLTFFEVEHDYVVDADSAVERLEALIAQVRDAAIGGLVSATKAMPPPAPSGGETRLVTRVRKSAMPSDEVIGTVGEVRENHVVENSRLPADDAVRTDPYHR